MKNTLSLLIFASILLWSAPAQGLSWAYAFVVWDGRVYEVKENEWIPDEEIGDVIGAVETKPDEMMGDYYGNASNFYDIGTPYAEIQSTSPSAAIAVQDGSKWIKAVYVHDAAFHPMNVITHPLFWAIAAAVIGIIVWLFVRKRKKRFQV